MPTIGQVIVVAFIFIWAICIVGSSIAFYVNHLRENK